MQILSLLVLPLAVAAYGYGNGGNYQQPPVAASPIQTYLLHSAPQYFYPRPCHHSRPVLNDEFQGPSIRAPFSNPFFRPRFHGERCLHHHYGRRYGSNFGHGRRCGCHRHHHHFRQPHFVPVFVQPRPVPAASAPSSPY